MATLAVTYGNRPRTTDQKTKGPTDQVRRRQISSCLIHWWQASANQAFKVFGPSILTARLVAAAFGLLLLGVFHELVRGRSGKITALIATFLFVASPGALLTCVSVMMEGPAFTTALVAVWLLFQWEKRKHWSWLVTSGAVMAVALQIKLTAALMVPAIGIELLLMCGIWWPFRDTKNLGLATPCEPPPGASETGAHGVTRATKWVIRCVILWSFGLVATFALIGMTWGRGQLASSWKSHTHAQAVEGMDMPQDHKFNGKLLWNHSECVAATAVCIVLAARQKRLREIAFPLVLLVTLSIVHGIHRPWWNYYYFHFDIPLAWMAGWAVSEVAGMLWASPALSSIGGEGEGSQERAGKADSLTYFGEASKQRGNSVNLENCRVMCAGGHSDCEIGAEAGGSD